VGFDAEKLSGPEGLRPPSESFLHTWLYKNKPEVQSVVHVHPEHAVLLTICEKEIFPIYGAFGPGARMAIDGVSTYPRSVRITTDALGEEFAKFVGERKYVLMRGHGASVVGSSVEDATVRAIVLNELVTLMYKAYQLGDPKPIPDEDIADITALSDGQQSRGSAGGRAGMLAAWRYYCSLAGEDGV
jgi:ribulose-5-phosphate 4-epimerase/fuculose-1-phosphate aldolase